MHNAAQSRKTPSSPAAGWALGGAALDEMRDGDEVERLFRPRQARRSDMTDKWKSLDPRTLPGHLARRLQQLAVALFSEEVAELGLTPVQYSALHAICQQPGIDQKTLAQSISYDAATIGGVIDRLEARGLVLRSMSPQDRRVRLISPTDEGLRILKAVIPRVLTTQERLLEPLSASERDELMRLMALIIEAQAELSSTPARD